MKEKILKYIYLCISQKMSENRHVAANTFLQRYIGIFNNGLTYIAELYRNNSKCQLMYGDGNFRDVPVGSDPWSVYGTYDIIKLKCLGRDMKMTAEEAYDVRTSHYPKAIAFNFKGSMIIDNEEKYIEQHLHIAMDDCDERIYIIDEKLMIMEKK
jgi:hypothetical protein